MRHPGLPTQTTGESPMPASAGTLLGIPRVEDSHGVKSLSSEQAAFLFEGHLLVY